MLDFISQISWLEWVATLSFIVYVILATIENPLCWPVSMIGVAIMIFISYNAKLYYDIILNAFYFIISLYGFVNWIRGGAQKKELPVSKISVKTVLFLFILSIAGIIIFGYLAEKYTDTDVAFWDASTTVLSFIGTWLLAQKKIENWIVWIVVDAIYIWLYYYKGLFLLSGLSIFYVAISFYGLYHWNKRFKETT